MPFTHRCSIWPFSLAVLLAFFTGCGNSSEGVMTSETSPSWGEMSQLRSGDIVLKRGKGRVSKKITDKLDEPIPLSHCGVIVRTGDSIHVIHSLAKEITGVDGVQKMAMKDFLDDCIKGYLYIVRYKGEGQPEKIAISATDFLERHVPFDYQLNNGDASSVTCSELVYWNLRQATGKDCLGRLSIDNREVFAFNSLLNEKTFQTIYHY